MRLNQWLGMFAAGIMIAGFGVKQLHAQDAAPTTTPTTSPTGEAELSQTYKLMAEDAGLAGDQLEKFTAAATQIAPKLAEWRASENGKKYAALRREFAAARRAADDAKAGELEKQMEPFVTEFNALRDAVRFKALSVLTPEQQQTMVEKSITRRLTRPLEDVNLTDEQRAKIAELVKPKVVEFLKEHPLDKEPMMQATVGLASSVAKSIREDILTADQRAKVEVRRPATRASTTAPSAS